MKKRALVFTLIALIGLVTLVVAQEVGNLSYGSLVLGNITAENASAEYTFNGMTGELVSVRVNSVTTGMDPNVTLLGPNGENLISNDSLPFDFSQGAAISYRLPVDGNYTIVVSGTAGGFLLSLDARPAPSVTVIELDTPITVSLPLVDPIQAYAFNTDPLNPMSLFFDADPLDADTYVEVLDTNGQRIASLRGELDYACLGFEPGDELNEVRIVTMPDAVGSLTLTLSGSPCTSGEGTQQPIPATCMIASLSSFNVRTGPGLQYPIFTIWSAGQPLEVTGQSQDGQWYTVQVLGRQAWVASVVVTSTGTCNDLPTIPSPPAPPVIVPVFTPTPEDTAEVTSEPPEVTATVAPPTDVPTEEATATVAPPTDVPTEEATAQPT